MLSAGAWLSATIQARWLPGLALETLLAASQASLPTAVLAPGRCLLHLRARFPQPRQDGSAEPTQRPSIL